MTNHRVLELDSIEPVVQQCNNRQSAEFPLVL